MESFARAALALLVLPVAVALSSCSGGGAPTGSTAVLAVRVTPANPTVEGGAALSFLAIAVLQNGESRDVTDDPGTNWLSTDTTVVQINADGTASALNPGESFISAEVDGVRSPAQKVVVTAPATPTPTPTPAPTATNVLISEVMYNPSTAQGGEPAGQYVELHNPTGAGIVLTGWTVNYNNDTGTAFTFPAFTLNAGAYVVLANDTTLFDGTEYPTVTNIFQYVLPNLSNTGDYFVLKNAGAVRVDEMAYGTGFATAKPAGWCPTGNPTGSDGTTVSRKPVNTDGNTCNDWLNNIAPNPGLPTP